MKKNIHIHISNILPLLLLIAIGIALAIGIGKATGLLASAHSLGLAHDVALLNRAAGANVEGAGLPGSPVADDLSHLAPADDLNGRGAVLLG